MYCLRRNGQLSCEHLYNLKNIVRPEIEESSSERLPGCSRFGHVVRVRFRIVKDEKTVHDGWYLGIISRYSVTDDGWFVHWTCGDPKTVINFSECDYYFPSGVDNSSRGDRVEDHSSIEDINATKLMKQTPNLILPQDDVVYIERNVPKHLRPSVIKEKLGVSSEQIFWKSDDKYV